MRKWMGIALGLSVFLAASSAVVTVAAGSRDGATETIMEAGYDVSPRGTLRIDVPDADIEVVSGSGNRAEVKILLGAYDMEWGRARVEAMNLRIDGGGSEVTVLGESPRKRYTWSRGDWLSLVVRVELPEDFNVNLNSDDGDISVERLRGQVEIRTSDGDIRLGQIDTRKASIATSDGDVRIAELLGDQITIRSSDGDIDVARIDGARVSVRTSDGDISLADASGNIEASTSDGDIDLAAGRLGETTLSSGDGDIVIRVAGGFGADVELKGEEVEISGPEFDGQRKEGSAAGRVNGGGASLRATTRDGAVILRSR